jgi:hypothetical protein
MFSLNRTSLAKKNPEAVRKGNSSRRLSKTPETIKRQHLGNTPDPFKEKRGDI